ncbi:MAG: hypothetical protein KGL95_09825 [Patescibacteria group bacterium]|nr:hypothetical protein [Patescibacteria group bacterium]
MENRSQRKLKTRGLIPMKIKKDIHESDEKREPILKNKYKNKVIVIGIIAAIVGSTTVISYKLDNAASSEFQPIDGIECGQMEYATFHIHEHLDVFVDGHHIPVPALIGIEDNTCLYWLHTHDASGIIHVESPQARNFTLYEFLDIWRSTGSTQPPDGEPMVSVNGLEVHTDLADVKLHAHDEIVLVYGSSPNSIPSFYQFPEGL